MSSILDALKKLEEDKAQQQARERAQEEALYAETSGMAVFDAETNHGDTSVRLTPKTLVLGGGAFAVLVIGVAILAAYMVSRPAIAPVQTAAVPTPSATAVTPPAAAVENAAPAPEPPAAESATPEAPAPEATPVAPVLSPESEPVVVNALESAPAPPVVVAPAPPPTPAPEPVAVTVAPEPTPTPPPAVEPAPEPAAAIVPEPTPTPPPAAAPAPTPVAVAQPEPVVETPAPVVEQTPAPAPEPVRVARADTPPPAPEPAPRSEYIEVTERRTPPPAPAPVPIDLTPPKREPASYNDVVLRELPVLRNTDKSRYGLSDMRVNMLGVASERRPTAFAILNLNKVYVGETIPNTDARLIAVEREGIGIEIVGSGQRFFEPF